MDCDADENAQEVHTDCTLGEYCPVCNAIVCSGFLHQKLRFGRWKKRWFKLYERGTLHIFEDKTESTPVNEVDIKYSCYDVHHGLHNGKFPGGVPRVCAFIVYLTNKKLYLYSSTVADTLRWVNTIRKNSLILSQKAEENKKMEKRLKVLRETGIEAARTAADRMKGDSQDNPKETVKISNPPVPKASSTNRVSFKLADSEEVTQNPKMSSELEMSTNGSSTFKPFSRNKKYSSNKKREQALKHLTKKSSQSDQVTDEQEEGANVTVSFEDTISPIGVLSYDYNFGSQDVAMQNDTIVDVPITLSDPCGLSPEPLFPEFVRIESVYPTPELEGTQDDVCKRKYFHKSKYSSKCGADARGVKFKYANKVDVKESEEIPSHPEFKPSTQEGSFKTQPKLPQEQANRKHKKQEKETTKSEYEHAPENDDRSDRKLESKQEKTGDSSKQYTTQTKALHPKESTENYYQGRQKRQHNAVLGQLARRPAVKHTKEETAVSQHQESSIDNRPEGSPPEESESTELKLNQRTRGEGGILVRNKAQKVKKHQTHPSTPERTPARESPDGGYIPPVRERPPQVQESPTHTQSRTAHPSMLSQPDVHLKLQSMENISNPYYVNMPPSMPDIRSESVFDMHRATTHLVGPGPDEGRTRPILMRGNAKKNRQGEPKVVHFETARKLTPQLTPVHFETTKSGNTALQRGTDQDHSSQYRTDTRPAPHSHTPARHGAIQRRNPPSHMHNKHQRKPHPSPEEQLNKLIAAIEFLGKPNADGSFTLSYNTIKNQNIYKFHDLIAVVVAAKTQYLLSYTENPISGEVYLRTIPQSGTMV